MTAQAPVDALPDAESYYARHQKVYPREVSGRFARLRSLAVIALLGLGGPELSQEHAEATGRVVSAMDPRYLSLLTLMLVPGTPLHQDWCGGTFQLLEPAAMLIELRQVIVHLEGLSGCIFRTNHASNYVPLAGTLPKDKLHLLTTLDAALARGRSGLRPETWRGL